MAIIDTIRSALGLEQRAAPAPPLTYQNMWRILEGPADHSTGEIVNPETALQLGTTFACVALISSQIASFPIRLWRHTANGKQEDVSSPLYFLLGVQPSPEAGAVAFWQAFVTNLLMYGNAFCEIQRDPDGNPIGLWLLDPRRTVPFRLPNGDVGFKTQDGANGAAQRIISNQNCLHVPYFSSNGVEGVSPLQVIRRTLAVAIAAEKYAAKFFGNSAIPSGILVGPDDMDEVQRSQAKSTWQAAYGSANQGRTAVMAGDWKFTPITVAPEQAQFLGTQNLAREQIAAAFGVPMALLGSTEHMSDNNSASQVLLFTTMTLRAILSRMESEVYRKLIYQPDATTRYSVEWDVSALTRGNPEQVMQTVQIGRNAGILSTNDARTMLGLNPISDEEGGNVVLAPMNTQSIISLANQPAQEKSNDKTT